MTMNRSSRWWGASAAALIAVVAMLAVLGAASGGGGAPWSHFDSKAATADLATVTVARGDIEDAVSALGSVQPQEFVDVGAQVSGQLKRLLVNVGDTVEAGAVLAEIDTAVLAARVEAAQATLKSLAAQADEKQAQLGLATRQHRRNTLMYAQDAVSRDALESSQAQTQITAAQVASLKAQRLQTAAALRVDQANLGHAKIRAPMAGTVVALNARQGQTLNASQQSPTLMRLARLDAMSVVTQVAEADVVRLKPGTEVWFNTLGRPERRWTAAVRQILPTPETLNNVVLYNVLFDVDNTDRALMTQMSAQVFFVLAKASDAVLVPVTALGAKVQATPRGSPAPADAVPPAASAGSMSPVLADARPGKATKTQAYRVRVAAGGRVEERVVTIGIVNRMLAQVVSGLAEGEQVVVGGAAGEARHDPKPKDAARRAARL